MIEFENYHQNLIVNDEQSLKDVKVCKSVIYRGTIEHISKKEDEDNGSIPPMAAAVIGLKNTAATTTGLKVNTDYWTDADVQERFLESKPNCYLVLGKPGTGAYSIGEAISKKYNCVHLCPKNMIVDEIEQRSPTGNCISFNLRQQNVIKFDTILSILRKKLESASVKHRGYVISGFPLISSERRLQYLSNRLYSEEGCQAINDLINDLLVNLKKKKSRPPKPEAGSPHSSITSDVDQPNEEEVEEEHDPEESPEETGAAPILLPKFILDSCTNIIYSEKRYITTKLSILLKQLTEIFNLNMAPDLIIYLTCSDSDLVTKRCHKYYNYLSNIYTIEPFLAKIEAELRWPSKYTMSDYLSPYDGNTFNPKYNCRQPVNFLQESIEQICNYKNHVSPFIQDKIKDFEPNHIIRLDATQTVHQMMHNVIERLVFLSINPVLIPEPLYLDEPPDDMDDFWKLVKELNVIRSGVLNFNRYPSLWVNRCPVELMKRKSQRGHPKLAVILFKHVYLLFSLENMIMFCRNPRPFLKLKYLEPTCRIIVIGTPSSGKSMISCCLSWLFDTSILNYDAFVKKEKEKKYETYAKTILSEIIATIEDSRYSEWQNKEMKRQSDLIAWNNTNINLLQNFVQILIDILKVTKREGLAEVSDEQSQEPEELDSVLLTNYNLLKNQLTFLPFLEDIDLCMSAVHRKSLLEFAPIELVTVTEKPKIPVLGDVDVTEAVAKYILANDLQKEIEPTNEELVNEISKILLNNDEESLKTTGTYGRFIIDGFPSDPEFWSYLSDEHLLPDYTIALIENREIEPELIQYYTDIHKCLKNHAERLTLAKDLLIKTKLFTKPFPNSNATDVRNIVNDFVATVLDLIFIDVSAPIHGEYKENLDADVGSLAAAIEKFREDWDSVKLKLEDNSKPTIEVELENKADTEVIDEVLLKLRTNYFLTCDVNDDEESETLEDEVENPRNLLTYNNPNILGDTNIFCPIAFFSHRVLWEGKSEFSAKYNNKLYYFSKEENLEMFKKDVVSYQEYNKPFKTLPPLRICVIGCIGSGKTTMSKLIAKELGLLHVDFSEVVNILLMPKHFKKVGLKYENNFTDEPIDEERIMEFQMDEENENLISGILSNETELRRMIYNYFERGIPVLSALIQRLIKKLWFTDPYAKTGFVLDGFPRLPSDVEEMVACYCIPDLVIELEGSSETMLQRLSPKMYKTWRVQLNEAKYNAKLKFDGEMRDWMNLITKKVVAKLILEDIFDKIFACTDEPNIISSADSVIMDAHPQGSLNLDANLFAFYNDIIQEFPAPTDLNEWEKADEARERIDSRLESIYEVDDEAIQSLKDILLEQKIKTISINGKKSIKKVLRIVLFKLSNLRSRCLSLFEQTFVIEYDIAEMLLMEGFYCFSKFHRMCPVFVLENPTTIYNPFKILKKRDKVFPVIHRAYVYFVFGEESLKKFRTNPLKYVSSDIMQSFKNYPLSISIIGAPKSGKSTLAERIARRYGLICISRGKAIRYLLENMYWTELGKCIQMSLSEGHCVHFHHIAIAVQTIAIDHRTMTNGYVFDGFPESAAEGLELKNVGLNPNIFFDISNNMNFVKKHAANEVYFDILKRKPPYAGPFIEYRYLNWSDKSYQIRDWIYHHGAQNLYTINGKESRWQCFRIATSYIEKTIPKIHYYLKNVGKKIVSPSCMGISNDVFQQRMSNFENMCPLCLQMNVLRHSNHPVDKKGIIQYKNKFYWICPDHMNSVLKYPDRYLSVKKIEIPEIPAKVKTVNTTFVYENGICMVTYAENLPSQKIVRGSNQYAASFRGKTYMFCSAHCLDKFLAKPHMYSDIVVFKDTKNFPKLCLKKLPNLGYLEQTVGIIITDACCSVNVLRPKYPGLDIKVSALIYIALYFKTHNPNNTNKDVTQLYNKAAHVYEARCKMILDLGLRLRSMDNPFASYPKCCNKIKYLDSSTVRKPSSMIYDTLSGHTNTSKFMK